MANGKTRVNYNPKTQNLPGTSMAVLARALQLIARRDARLRELPESQPCGLISSSSTNFWSQAGTASSTSLTTSKENTSSKSSYSGKSSSSRTPAPASDEAQKSKKRKVSPSIYQQEVARQKRERQKRTIPQYSVDTTSPRSTAISSRSPSPTDTMTPAEAKELISTAVGTQRRHEVYHGTILVSNDPLFRQIFQGGILAWKNIRYTSLTGTRSRRKSLNYRSSRTDAATPPSQMTTQQDTARSQPIPSKARKDARRTVSQHTLSLQATMSVR